MAPQRGAELVFQNFEKMSFLRVAALCLLVLHGSRAVCDDFESASSITCQLLFDHFQAALLSQPLNLYNLRKIFLPLTRAQPTLVNVSYYVSVTPVTDVSCSVIFTGRETTQDLLQVNTTTFDRNFAWIDRTFYAIFHPAQVNRLQPQLVHRLITGLELYSTNLAALGWDGVGPILTVQLYLVPVYLPCRPTVAELYASLRDITALLKEYAVTQENITQWNSENLAQVKSGLVFSPQWYKYTAVEYPISSSLPTINLVFTILISLVLSIAIYYYIWTKMPSSPRHKNFLLTQTLLWTAIVMLLQTVITLLYNELESMIMWCAADTCTDAAAIAKFGLLGYMAFFNGIVFTVFLVYYVRGRLRPKQLLLPGIQPFLIGIPFVSILAALVLLVFRVLIQPCSRHFKFVHHGAVHVSETFSYFFYPKKVLLNGFRVVKFVVVFLPFTTIFTFLALAIFSVIPIMLQALVYPFRILATYSFVLTINMTFFLAVFLVTFFWKKKGIKNTSLKLCFLLTLPTVVLVFIFMINIPFASLYQLLSSGTLTNNPVTLGIISIAPSLLLSSPLVWILRNRVIPAFVDGEMGSVGSDSCEEGGEEGDEESVRREDGSGEVREGGMKRVGDTHATDNVVENPAALEQSSQNETEM